MSHKGLETPLGEAIDLCSQLLRLSKLDTVGNRGFSGAAKAARRHAPQGVPALILMGDWCAAARPMFENQVCKQLAGCQGDRFAGLKVGAQEQEKAWR